MPFDPQKAYTIALCERLMDNLIQGVPANPGVHGAIPPTCCDGERDDVHTIDRELVRLYFGEGNLATHGTGGSVVFFPREETPSPDPPLPPNRTKSPNRIATSYGDTLTTLWFYIWGDERAIELLPGTPAPYKKRLARMAHADWIARKIVHLAVVKTFPGAVFLADGEWVTAAEQGGANVAYGAQKIMRYNLLTQYLDEPVDLVKPISSTLADGQPVVITPGL